MNRTALIASVLLHALGATCAIMLGGDGEPVPELAQVDWEPRELFTPSNPNPIREPVVVEETETEPLLEELILPEPVPETVDDPPPEMEVEPDPLEQMLLFARIPIAKPERPDPVEASVEESPVATVESIASPYVEARPRSDNPPPNYPRRARRRGHEGEVIVEVVVRADGTAGAVEIFKATPHSELNREALRAVQEWRFIPAMRDGEAVESVVQIPVIFRLTDRTG